jgi:hypothetical protein
MARTAKDKSAPERFKTHANYLRAFGRLIPASAIGGSLEPLRIQFKATPRVGGACKDADAVFRSLRMAWSTELLLDFTSSAFDEDELVRIANNWAVVQVYYMFYHTTQALSQAKGFPRTPNHSQTQKQFKSHWADRVLDLPPWSLARAGDEVANWPQAIQLEDVHSWVACDRTSKWLLAAKALRTTREDAVNDAYAARRTTLMKEKRKAWQTEESERLVKGKKARVIPRFARPILSAAEKTRVEQSLRATTVMDYLYRLRIGTNYEDSAMFTDGPEAEGEAVEVRQQLRRLGASTMLIHELAIADLLGSAAVATHARDLLRSSAPPGATTGLAQRLPQIDAHRQ